MPAVIFATPFFTPFAMQAIESMLTLSDVRLGVVSQDGQELLPAGTQSRLAGHWRVQNALDTGQLLWAVRGLSGRIGQIERLLAANEQIQVPAAEVRHELGLPGLDIATTQNFRDKARMKDRLRQAGLPCARHHLARQEGQAWAAAAEMGYPMVLKPPAGAASQETFRVNNSDDLVRVLAQVPPSESRPVLCEEFITGEEYSFDVFSLNGRPIFHSLTHYMPNALETMRTPWIQMRVVLPREVDSAQYDDIRQIGFQAIQTLGMTTGMNHLEWFRRKDGTVVVSEVAARPPGGQLTTLINRAHDIDCLRLWAELLIFGQTDLQPARHYAAGLAYLRGQGSGRVKAIYGLDQAYQEVGHLICDGRLPQIGQAKGANYEGEGFVVMRHPQTEVVEQALLRFISLVRIELG